VLRSEVPVAGIAIILSLTGGCVETRRSLGEDCLKDNDCLSGTCLQLRCAAPPPTTDSRPMAEAGSEAPTQPLADAGLDSTGTDD
jgi:hypothetical protein